MCHVSGVMCHVLCVVCHLSHITTPTATATDPSPAQWADSVKKAGMEVTLSFSITSVTSV